MLGVGYVDLLDCGDYFIMCPYIYQKHQVLHLKYIQFLLTIPQKDWEIFLIKKILTEVRDPW